MTYDWTQIEKMDAEKIGQELHELAYFAWERAGRPLGQELQFWLTAEREMFGYTAGEVAALDDLAACHCNT